MELIYLIKRSENKAYMIDAREAAPLSATTDMFLNKADSAQVCK